MPREAFVPPEPPRVYTADEAAEILKCTASWLREMARKRRIPFTMLSGSYRWTPAHLEEILRIFEHQPEPELPPRPRPWRPPEAPQGREGTPLLQGRAPKRMRRGD